MRNKFFIIGFCVIALTFAGSADDEVQLKSKSYDSRKNVSTTTLRSRTYESSPLRTHDYKQAEQTSSRWWKIFTPGKSEPVSAPLSGTAAAQSTPLRQDKQISAATIKAVPQSVTEKKPYETGANKSVKPYTPDNRPKAKNPLLRPRQNIKEPQ